MPPITSFRPVNIELPENNFLAVNFPRPTRTVAAFLDYYLVGGANFLAKVSRQGAVENITNKHPAAGTIRQIYNAGNGRIYTSGTELYYSDDDGETWTNPFTAGSTLMAFDGQGNGVVNGTVAIGYTSDYGTNWTISGPIYSCSIAFKGDTTYLPESDIFTVAQTSSRNFVFSTDKGVTWQNGPIASSYDCLGELNGVIYGADQVNGNMARFDSTLTTRTPIDAYYGGKNNVLSGSPLYACHGMKKIGDKLYSIHSDGAMQFTKNGEEWLPVTNHLNQASDFWDIDVFDDQIIAPIDDTVVLRSLVE